MTTYHQVMWLDARYTRPTTVADNPALENFDVKYDQVYQIDLLGFPSDDSPPVVLALNQSHVAPVHFPAGSMLSDPVILFATQVREQHRRP